MHGLLLCNLPLVTFVLEISVLGTNHKVDEDEENACCG
jgi:hypothetical protein